MICIIFMTEHGHICDGGRESDRSAQVYREAVLLSHPGGEFDYDVEAASLL